MTGKLPLFFKETIGAMLNLCLTVYIYALGIDMSNKKIELPQKSFNFNNFILVMCLIVSQMIVKHVTFIIKTI